MSNILNWDSFNEAYNKPRAGGKKRWSVKYKKSINCSNPKGFSQKQYCKRKRKGGGYKNESVEEIERFDSKEPIEEIKSVFQDIIDDYNLEELPADLDYGDYSRPGIYYHISNFYDIAEKSRRDNGTLRRCQYELTLYCPTEWTVDLDKEDPKYQIWSNYVKIIQKEVPEFVDRLQSMGYRLKYEELDQDDILELLVDDDEFTIQISLDSEKWGSYSL